VRNALTLLLGLPAEQGLDLADAIHFENRPRRSSCPSQAPSSIASGLLGWREYRRSPRQQAV